MGMRVTKTDVLLSIVSGILELGVIVWLVRRRFAR